MTSPKEEAPLMKLLSMQKRTNKKVLTTKKGIHMISFPIYWFKKWDSRHIIIECKDDSIFVYSSDVENKTDRVMKIGGSYYIKINDDIFSTLGYPEKLTMEYFETYLVIVVPEDEKDQIRIRRAEVARKQHNEKMKLAYSRRI